MHCPHWRAATFIVGLGLWVAVPVVAVGWVLMLSTQQTAATPTPEVWVPVRASPDSVTRDAAVQLLWEPSAILRAPAWNGLTLRVFVEPGASLSSGSAVAEVNGITRRAYATDIPFFRLLQVGDDGPDVLALNSLLAPYGSIASSDSFQKTTLRALRVFAAEIGVPAASDVTAFDPSWVIHLPVGEPVLVGSVGLVAGELAPGSGTTILSGTTNLTGARLVAVTSETTTAPLTRSNFLSVTAPLALVPDQAESVRYRDLSLKVEAGSWVAVDDLGTLAGLIVGNPASLPVMLTRSASSDDVLLPASAVAAGSLSQVCISRSGSSELLDIEIVSGTAGKVVARAAGLVVGVTVRIPNPSVTPCA